MTEGALAAMASAGAALALLLALIALFALWRSDRGLGSAQAERFDRLDAAGERLARELRAEMREGARRAALNWRK